MGRLLAAIVLFTGLYAGAWFWGASFASRQVEAKVAEAEALGWQVSYDGLRKRGFPSRIDLTVDNLRAVAPSGLTLAAPSLQAMALVYQPRNVIVAWPEGQTLDVAGQTSKLEADRLRASLHAGDPGWPDPATLEGGRGFLAIGRQVTVEWDEILAATRDTGETEEVYVRLTGASLVTRLGTLGPTPQIIIEAWIAPDGKGEAALDLPSEIATALSLAFGQDLRDGVIGFDLGPIMER